MDELQLRMTVQDVIRMADAIERDMTADPYARTALDLVPILTWLRYRIARRSVVTTASPQG